MIKIRFVTAKDPISDVIRRAEYDFWASHTEALMPDGTLLGALCDGGVQARPGNYDAATWTEQQIVAIPTVPAQDAAFEAFLRAQVGKPYDFEAVLSLGASPFLSKPAGWRDAKAWFCSELMAAACEQAGIIERLATDITRVTPRDLLLILSGRYLLAGAPKQRAA